MLIVEDGTGLVDAQSYISAAELLTYASLRGLDLSDYSEAELESAIYIAANDFIDIFYSFNGDLVNEDQGLSLPTSEVDFGSVQTWRNIKEANANGATLSLTGSLLVDTTEENTAGKVKSESSKLDVLDDSVEYFEGTSLSSKYPTPIIDRLLRPYTISGGVSLKVT